MDRALTAFIWIWSSFVVLGNLVGVAGMLVASETVWAGLALVQDIYSPFNLINYAFNMMLLLPAIGAYVWREKRRRAAALISSKLEDR